MSTKLSPAPSVAAFNIFSEDTSAQHSLGAYFEDDKGRGFRYCKVGGTALVPGKLQQAPAEVTNHQNLAVAAHAAGATTLTVTLGATAATANQYAGGWAQITVTPGVGYQYQIKSNPAADASASLALTLEDAIEVALTASSKVDLIPNPYNGVIVNPATASSAPVGVAVNNIAAASYGWLQVRGPALVLADGAITVGTSVVASNGVAGAVEPATGAQAVVGTAITGIADTEYGSVLLRL